MDSSVRSSHSSWSVGACSFLVLPHSFRANSVFPHPSITHFDYFLCLPWVDTSVYLGCNQAKLMEKTTFMDGFAYDLPCSRISLSFIFRYRKNSPCLDSICGYSPIRFT